MGSEFFISETWSVASLDSSLPTALEIDPPAVVTFETSDRTFRRLAAGETLHEIGVHNANLVTGPLVVRGAEPGDALRIEVMDVQVRSAWSLWFPGLGPLGGRTDRLQIREIPLEDGFALINERAKVPIAPMIGVVGLAPATGAGSTFRPAYPWGGNMDLRELSPGRGSIHLPVQVAGAMLFVGDLHAAMGQGEPASVAFESPGTATIRVSLEKGHAPRYPRLRDGRDTMFLGVADTFEDARQAAVEQAFDYLTEEVGLSPFDAYAYISSRVALRLGGPASAIVMAVVPDLDSL